VKPVPSCERCNDTGHLVETTSWGGGSAANTGISFDIRHCTSCVAAHVNPGPFPSTIPVDAPAQSEGEGDLDTSGESG